MAQKELYITVWSRIGPLGPPIAPDHLKADGAMVVGVAVTIRDALVFEFTGSWQNLDDEDWPTPDYIDWP